MLDFVRFYGRVLRRWPGVFMDAAGKVGALALLVALVILWIASDKSLASKVVSFQGFASIWAIIPSALILGFGLAKANYDEAKLFRQPRGATNQVTPPTDPTPVIAGAGSTVYALPGSNVVQLQEPPGTESPEAGTGPASGQ